MFSNTEEKLKTYIDGLVARANAAEQIGLNEQASIIWGIVYELSEIVA